MGYKEEMLKKIEALKEYEKLRATNPVEAYKFKTQFKVREDFQHVSGFFTSLSAGKGGVFSSKEAYDQFIATHQDVLNGNRIPYVKDDMYGRFKIPDVDFGAIFDAIEKDAGISNEALEEAYKNADPNMRANRRPLEKSIANIKTDVDALFDENTAKEIKESLDYANEEIIAKTGANVLDDATKINACYPELLANKEFKNFVKDQGLDENVVVNKIMGESGVSGEAFNEANFPVYKPFLKMNIELDEDFKQKLIGLDNLLKEEGLLQRAAGGESGTKEYGLVDYFQKNYELKTAIVDQTKMQTEAEKKTNLLKIDRLAKETKDVSAKYDRVFDYIEKNFDLENANLPGNLYSGRPADVQGNIEGWRPNLPPKYDFENTPKVIFLNGFNQLKAACQNGEVSLEEYLENPTQAYLKGAEKASKISDARYYPPRSDENTLGKRLARTMVCEDVCYPHVAGQGMIGGRAIEFLTNVDPNKEKTAANTIISCISREFNEIYDHSPNKYFGSPYEPEVDNIKNLFAFADKEDDLYKVSSHYHNKDAEKVGINEQYKNVVKEKKNVPVDQEYRRIMNAMKDFATERKYMFDHQDEFTTIDSSGVSGGLVTYSLGALLHAGRDYFVDYMKENNLSLASIQNSKLREEVTNFITNPVETLAKHVSEDDLGAVESMEAIRGNYGSLYRAHNAPNAESFFEKFNEFNNKPNGRNVGKTFTKILSDNKGSWWERLRGKTSKEYTALQKIAKEVCKPDSQCYGDDRALYFAAKAYKEYKMPEGTNFEQISSTGKKRVEFCDSIIKAYEAKHPDIAVQNEEVPAVNNNVIDQEEFQNQLQNDLNPKQEVQANVGLVDEAANEKDPPDEGVEP